MEQFAWHDWIWIIPNLVLYLSIIGFWIYTNIDSSLPKYARSVIGWLSLSQKWRKQEENSRL
ncbi:hypothetical protein I2I11_17530 [Pontibacter sp. 172403-2]|uniref:hypothetical protein n=1 Tax=Pontibacter rufus TaxID=2791028 RepID=UPI0018AF722A|nr:hypothetical protein [Pontibacter sp. 172403-2]MBF9255104.1 hypothetical protein [Pontibacter sp. 172403-2]